MAISLRLSDEETLLFKKIAEMRGISVSEMIRRAVLSDIEDEYDLAAYDKAMQDYRANPTTYSLDEIEKELLG